MFYMTILPLNSTWTIEIGFEYFWDLRGLLSCTDVICC
jgi:hypothetical protein